MYNCRDSSALSFANICLNLCAFLIRNICSLVSIDSAMRRNPLQSLVFLTVARVFLLFSLKRKITENSRWRQKSKTAIIATYSLSQWKNILTTRHGESVTRSCTTYVPRMHASNKKIFQYCPIKHVPARSRNSSHTHTIGGGWL